MCNEKPYFASVLSCKKVANRWKTTCKIQRRFELFDKVKENVNRLLCQFIFICFLIALKIFIFKIKFSFLMSYIQENVIFLNLYLING